MKKSQMLVLLSLVVILFIAIFFNLKSAPRYTPDGEIKISSRTPPHALGSATANMEGRGIKNSKGEYTYPTCQYAKKGEWLESICSK